MSIVDDVLDALNAHDLERFVACYAPDATIEDGYDRVGARGHAELRERYAEMFAQHPELHVRALARIEEGEFVVQHEQVTGRGEPRRHVAVYLVRGGMIARERLLR